MTGAALIRDRLRNAGVTLALDVAHNLEWRSEADPPPDLLAEARRWKPALLALLAAEAANDATAAPLPLAEIVAWVQRIAATTPAEATEVLRQGIAAMLGAGHGQAEALMTLLPAVPLGADADLLKVAIWDAVSAPCEVSQRHRPPVGAELEKEH